ncbi:MAG: hypothetical protein Q7T54_01700, partial [Candidatus Levybacteria bacterium]|nr:hypothetical protein [Candidatus Levybacteria bacterium]
KIITFFASIFGGKNDTQNLVGPAPTPTLTEAQKAQIQIGTLKPASEVVIPAEKDENNCSFIRFNFF